MIKVGNFFKRQPLAVSEKKVKMKAIVKKIDYHNGYVYVETEDNNISKFEMLLDDNFEIEDVLFWEEHQPLGHCKIKNITQSEVIEVFFQTH